MARPAGNINARRAVAPAGTAIWEKIATLACGIIGTASIVALVTFNPDPSEAQWRIYWAVLALTVACVGALLPGFLEIRYRTVLRAGGALACFTLVLYSSGQIKGLGGPTHDDLISQANTLLHEGELDRGVLGPASLDRFEQAKTMFKKAQDGPGLALANIDICRAQYAIKEFQRVLASCSDAQHELDLIPQAKLSEQERLKLLALTTLYYISAQDRVRVTLDTPLGIRQALDYAAATKDVRFTVEFSKEAAQALFENNGGPGGLASWAYFQALASMTTFDLNNQNDLDYVAGALPSVVQSFLLIVINGKGETQAMLDCANIRTDIFMVFSNLEMWAKKVQWQGAVPRDKLRNLWNTSRCVAELRTAPIAENGPAGR